MQPKPVPPYVVYLLHFDRPVGHAQHYMGICKVNRLHWRQLEHLRGNGARLTARAAELNIGWTVANLYPTADPLLERRLKTTGRFSSSCKLCANRRTDGAALVVGQHYAPKKRATEWNPKRWP